MPLDGSDKCVLCGKNYKTAEPLGLRDALRIDCQLCGTYDVSGTARVTLRGEHANLLPFLSARIGKAKTHSICLLAGAAGYASFFVLKDPQALILSEIGVGIAWASILAMPYAILASSLPQAKLGIYMGLFNIFVVVPQLLVATAMGSIMKAFFPDQPIWTMAFAAGTLVLAALAMTRVKVPGED